VMLREMMEAVGAGYLTLAPTVTDRVV